MARTRSDGCTGPGSVPSLQQACDKWFAFNIEYEKRGLRMRRSSSPLPLDASRKHEV